ncbi:imidazole glycerol phosphate synthase subunit HisH [Undibacterium sp. Dicai25W]|uniref:imidazole glycerol phosphate synthase subunit HisH n=1 Tax=Undibacterium sp. Dicai25W TaxID=3413034 RepID=UPI003BF26AF3
MSNTVTLIDYGLGNLLSVARAFEHCGAKVVLSHDPSEIEHAERLVLPGVGAFADGMHELRERGLVDPIRRYAESDRPLLGICLGMQMLVTTSEEFGEHKGLDLIPGRARAIPQMATNGVALKIPHIGWSALHRPEHADWQGSLLVDTAPGSSVYLVHSFAVETDDQSHLVSYCNYGGHSIAATIQRGAVVGCQFHPEKSGPEGLRMLAAFMRS